MKLEQTFEVAEWEDVGEMGFKPIPSGEAWDPLTESFGLAHDFMEHAGQFSLRGEIKAHAAMYYIRYETGHCPRGPYGKPLTVYSFIQEWVQLYRGLESGATLSACEPQEKLNEAQEDALAQIISGGKRAVLLEIEKQYLDTNAYAMLSRHFAEWFRKGYHEAAARYSVIDSDGALFAFTQVEEYFDRRFKEELIEGNTVKISLDLETGKLTFEEIAQCWMCGHDHNGEFGEICEDCIDADSEEE